MLFEAIPSVKEHTEILLTNDDVIPVSHWKKWGMGAWEADEICKTPCEISATLIYSEFFLCESVLDNTNPGEDFLLENVTVQSSQQMSSLSGAAVIFIWNIWCLEEGMENQFVIALCRQFCCKSSVDRSK